MGWNLPPGCTDKDIDDAINGDEPPMTPEEQDTAALCEILDEVCPPSGLTFAMLDQMDKEIAAANDAEAKQMRESNEAFYRREREYIEFHRRNLLPIDSLREAIDRYKECGE